MIHMSLSVEEQGSAHGWPLEKGSSCQKIPNSSSIAELIHPPVCNFNMKNHSGYLKMLAIEIQFVEFLLGFIFLRLYKQLQSDIPAFKNSVRKPSMIWFVFTAERLFFNPFGVVGFDTPASRTNEKSSGRVCVEAQRHPSPHCTACPEDGGSLKTADKGQNSCIPLSSCTPCQKPGQEWKSYWIDKKLKPVIKQEVEDIWGKQKAKEEKTQLSKNT